MFSIIVLLLVINFDTNKKKIIFEKHLIYLGKLSYSLYLWHFPVLFFSSYYIEGIFKYTLVIVLTLLLSHLSYNMVEIPLRKLELNNKKIKNFFLVFVGVLVIIVFSHISNLLNIRNLINHNLVNINNIFKSINLTKNSLEYRTATKWFLDNDSCNNNLENFGIDYLNCIRNLDNENLFFISGDSFGEHFVNILASKETKTFKNIYLSKIDNKIFVDKNLSNHRTIDSFLNLSKSFKSSYFILSISHQENFDIKKMIIFLSNLDQEKVIIIKPHQRTNKRIADCINYKNYLKIINSYIDEKKCKFDSQIDQERIDIVNDKLKKISVLFDNIKFFDFNNLICKTKDCNLYNKNMDLIYFTDNTHLTLEFAELVSQYFEKWFLDEYSEYNQ